MDRESRGKKHSKNNLKKCVFFSFNLLPLFDKLTILWHLSWGILGRTTMNKKVIVTGSEGFIGSHLVEALVARGDTVKAFVLYNSFDSCGWLDTLPRDIRSNVEVVYGDLRDFHSVKNAMKGCDEVYHLGALIAIPYSYHAPESYVDVNIKGTLNVLQAARDHQVTKILHTSTSEVYGSAQFVPITEEHPLVGQSPYSASKIGADQIATSFYLSFGTPVTIARPFNTFGPRQSTRAVIPTIISQLLVNKNAEIKLGNVDATRDFNYVLDTVQGMIELMSSDKTLGQTINIGSGYEISVAKTAQLIATLMNAQLTVVEDQQRFRPEKSEVNRLCACNKKIKELTPWMPQYSGPKGFENGLKKTIEWFSREENLQHYKSGFYTL